MRTIFDCRMENTRTDTSKRLYQHPISGKTGCKLTKLLPQKRVSVFHHNRKQAEALAHRHGGQNYASNRGKNSEFSSVKSSTGERTLRLFEATTSCPQEKQKFAPPGKRDWHCIQVFR